MNEFDIIVIGAGPGGYIAAIRGAQKGLRTALVERSDIGGTCLNRGCVPTKSLLHSARLYRQAKESEIFGISAGNVSFDFRKINERKDGVVNLLRGGTEKLIKSSGVSIVRGKASVKSASTVIVEASGESIELTAKNIVIASGSRPNRLPYAIQNLPGVFTSDEALTGNVEILPHKDVLPSRMLILGGGVIGVEFAGFYNGLGCEVTLADSMNTLLGRTDAEIAKSLAKFLSKRGVKVITSAELDDIRESKNGLICRIRHKDETKEFEVDGVLVSIGRTAVTDCLLPEAGVELDSRGSIITDSSMRTNVPGIYAVGDCVSGSVQLAHAASAQGINAINAIMGEEPSINMSAVPACVYSNPELASVGLTQAEAEAKGINVKIGKYLTNGNAKSIITDEERGFVKLVFDAGTNALIGAQLMCARATDIIGELTLAVAERKTAKELASVIRPHPTYEEAITEAVLNYI